MKAVKITIIMDEQFIQYLHTNTSLSGRKKDPIHILASAVQMEARGAMEDQVDACIPPEWKGQLQVVHEEREVIQDLPDGDDEEAKGMRGLLIELQWRGVLEAHHVEQMGQTALADKLVKMGKLKKGRMKSPTSGDYVKVYKHPRTG